MNLFKLLVFASFIHHWLVSVGYLFYCRILIRQKSTCDIQRLSCDLHGATVRVVTWAKSIQKSTCDMSCDLHGASEGWPVSLCW